MEMTPKLPRKSLSLTTRLRNRSSASPSPKTRLKNDINPPTSPIAIPNTNLLGVDATPPHRKFTFNFPYSPSNDVEFSPSSRLSQSSNNSPEVTWRWTQDDPAHTSKSTPNNTNIRELRKKRSLERKEELRRAEIEQRKAIKSKREDVLKKQCEQMELIISKKRSTSKQEEEKKEDFIENKNLSPQGSSVICFKDKENDLFDDSIFENILQVEQKDSKTLLVKESKQLDTVKDTTNDKLDTVTAADPDLNLLLDDSESEGLLLEASQQVESSIEPRESFKEIPIDKDKEKSSNYDFLQDSFDDCFVMVDDDILAAEAKKLKTSFQRYKSMPTDSPTCNQSTKTSQTRTNSVQSSSDSLKIKRYSSSSTIRPNSRFR